jgi:hypothetical protein
MERRASRKTELDVHTPSSQKKVHSGFLNKSLMYIRNGINSNLLT